MGLLVGFAMLPMALAMLVIMVVAIVQEPLGLVVFLGSVWTLRALWRAHRRSAGRLRSPAACPDASLRSAR